MSTNFTEPKYFDNGAFGPHSQCLSRLHRYTRGIWSTSLTTGWEVANRLRGSMALTATLGPIRSTTPRVAGAVNPISTFSALLADVKGAGLLARTRIFYISVFTTLVLALGGAITGFILLGDSWFQLLIAGALGIIFTQFAFLAHEASHRQVFESGTANDRVGRILAAGVRRHQLLVVDEQAHPPPRATRTRSARTPTSRSTRSRSWRRMPRSAAASCALHHPPAGLALLPAARARGHQPARASRSATSSSRGKVDGPLDSRSRCIGAAPRPSYVGAVFLVLPLGMAFAFLGVQLAVFGVYMGASFAPNHNGMPIIPADAKLDFFSKQVLHLAQHPRRLVDDGLHGRTQLPGRAPPVPEHAAPAPLRRRARSCASTALARRSRTPRRPWLRRGSSSSGT